jgi:head-tail adaptor
VTISNVTAIAEAAAATVNALMLPDRCDLQTVTRTSDSAGGGTDTWLTVASVPCQVTAITARNATIAERLTEVADFEITVPAGTPVEASQRIKHTRQATTTYYAISGIQQSKTFELARTILARVTHP